MEDREDTLYAQDLENLVIKDKEYHYKRRKKFLLIFIPIILCILIATVLAIILTMKWGGKIICKYPTTNDNENILLININNDIEYSLIIDDNNYDKNNYHTFEKAGIHNVIFHFKNKLNSLEGFFKEVNNLIEVDFTNLETKISNLWKIYFIYAQI